VFSGSEGFLRDKLLVFICAPLGAALNEAWVIAPQGHQDFS
jgi:hypothetical protein